MCADGFDTISIKKSLRKWGLGSRWNLISICCITRDTAHLFEVF